MGLIHFLMTLGVITTGGGGPPIDSDITMGSEIVLMGSETVLMGNE